MGGLIRPYCMLRCNLKHARILCTLQDAHLVLAKFSKLPPEKHSTRGKSTNPQVIVRVSIKRHLQGCDSPAPAMKYGRKPRTLPLRLPSAINQATLLEFCCARLFWERGTLGWAVIRAMLRRTYRCRWGQENTQTIISPPKGWYREMHQNYTCPFISPLLFWHASRISNWWPKGRGQIETWDPFSTSSGPQTFHCLNLS